MHDAQSATADVIVQKFDKALLDRSAFSCGFKPIDNFLQKSLSEHSDKGLVVAYVATIDTHVVGFYTLCAHMVCAEVAHPLLGRTKSPSVPAWYITAVAVDRAWQGRGIGNALMIDAMHLALRLSGEVGAAAIILDVLEDDAFERRLKFYTELGFRMMDGPHNKARMFIPISDVRASLG